MCIAKTVRSHAPNMYMSISKACPTPTWASGPALTIVKQFWVVRSPFALMPTKNTSDTRSYVMVASLGLALASMKQLKFLGGLVGPGEILLAISTAWTLFGRGTVALTPIKFMAMPIFIVGALAIIMTFSTLINLLILDRPGINYISDMVSVWASLLIVFAIVISCRNVHELFHILILSAVFTVLISSFLLIYSKLTGSSSFASMPLYYWGTRFQGLSPDPNQLARVCATAPFLAFLAMRGASRSLRIFCFVVVCASVYVGIETESQSCWLAWAAGLLGAFGVYLLNGPRRGAGQPKISMRTLGLVAASGAAMALVVATLPALVGKTAGSSIIGYLSTTGGSDRAIVAALSIDRIASNPAFGLGFGQHIVWSTAHAGTFVIESHNAFLDVAVRGGLPALALMTLITGAALLGAIKQRNAALLGALIATIIFGMGITPIRQPTYWLILGLTAGAAFHRPIASARRILEI